MFTLQVTADFDAAHRLPEYHGPCRRIHGHRWVIHARYRFSDKLNKGMCYDLVHLKGALRDAVSTYDHRYLNDIMTVIPTAENIARTIFTRLIDRVLSVHREHLYEIEVYETPDSSATYSKPLIDECDKATVQVQEKSTPTVVALSAQIAAVGNINTGDQDGTDATHK